MFEYHIVIILYLIYFVFNPGSDCDERWNRYLVAKGTLRYMYVFFYVCKFVYVNVHCLMCTNVLRFNNPIVLVILFVSIIFIIFGVSLSVTEMGMIASGL